MPYEQILYEIDDQVGTLTLNRPARLNAWTTVMGEEFRHAMAAAAQDPRVRAIVITGAGAGFCAGADMQQLETAAGRQTPRPAPETVTGEDIETLHSFNYLLKIPKPVLAGINGGAAGIGFCLPLCCDLRYMAKGARLATSFARRGLIAEYGSSWLLPRLIGPMNAMDLLLSGRTIDAEEAEILGLVRVLPAANFKRQLHEAAMSYGKNCSPRSMAAIKKQVIDGYGQSLSQATALAASEMFSSHASEDFKEGVAHFLERRPPTFTGQ